jgi:thioredoxin-related protein
MRIIVESHSIVMMKVLLMIALLGSSLSTAWIHNLDEAKLQAQKENKLILLNFSGSDWCGPCIRMHREIFDSEAFTKFAAEHLVLVNADFPRLKKNQPSREQQAINERIADDYNKKGQFPLTLLLDQNGKVLKSWDGFPGGSPADFCTTISQMLPATP